MPDNLLPEFDGILSFYFFSESEEGPVEIILVADEGKIAADLPGPEQHDPWRARRDNLSVIAEVF